MTADYLDLLREVLDHEIVDVNEIPCGMVDDLAVEGDVGSELRVTALLVGPGIWSQRLPRPIGALARKLFGKQRVRVPWSEIARIGERIELRSTASALGLGVSDRRLGRWISRFPRS